MKKLWLYLHFPRLQMDCQFRDEKQQPVIILDAKDNRTLQLNDAAKVEGIRPGMGLGTASALSAQLRVEPYNVDIEVNKLKYLSDSLYQLTSDISLFKPNGILLRIHNMLRFYQGLDNYWQAICEALQKTQTSWQYATGSTPLAAKILAESGWDQISNNHQVMRTEVLKLPLERTELWPKTIEHLKRIGIKSIADLAKLPLADIAKRFDIHLVTYTGKLLGELHHGIHFYHPEKSFNRRLELLYEIDNTQTLLHPTKQLLEALEAFLQIREQVTEHIILGLHQKEVATLNVDIMSAAGEYRAQQWLNLLQLKLESITLTAPVYALSLTTGTTRLRTPDTQDFFSGKKSTFSNNQLTAILQAKLGEAAVQRINLNDDFRPEHINQYATIKSSSINGSTINSSSLKQSPAIPDLLFSNRPLFFLSPAQPLKEKVRLIKGPERISSGWWDDKPVQRDYFIAYSATHRWYWVYRTAEQKWYLHGVFS